MSYSILQISDLHKMQDTSYNSLLQTLKTDREQYISEGILPPKYIVVCGDLIQGGSSCEEIENQYKEVENFLGDLVQDFLNGDKNRIFIVPGNHDVNRMVSKESMAILPNNAEKIKEYTNSLYDPSNNTRWNWGDLSFYKISDKDLYKHRFDCFKKFYNSFFSDIRRKYPEDSIKTAYIVKYPEDRLALVGFNSCNYLDHLNFAGNIDEDSIASVSDELRNLYNHGYLNIGVWHHHSYGSPYETNYMNRDIFNSMAIQDYIKIGLYGHQHKVEIAEEYTSRIYYDDDQRKSNKMLLISSGTLFGGDKTLPTGVKRQYNIIEINNNHGNVDVEINIREDINPSRNSKIPIWKSFPIAYSENNKIKAEVICKDYSVEDVIREIDNSTRESNNYEKGYVELKTYINQPLARELSDSYLSNCSPEFIIKELNNPQTNDEFILLSGAIIKTENKDRAKQLLNNKKFLILSESDGIIKDLKNQIMDIL